MRLFVWPAAAFVAAASDRHAPAAEAEPARGRGAHDQPRVDGACGRAASPASLRPRLAIRDGLSAGRSATARASETEPATACSVAVAPRLRRSAARAARREPHAHAAGAGRLRAAAEPHASARRRPSRAAARAEAMSAVVRLQSPSQPVSARRRPGGGVGERLLRRDHREVGRPGAHGPAAWKLIAPLEAGVAGGVRLARAHRVGAAARPAPKLGAERAGGVALRRPRSAPASRSPRSRRTGRPSLRRRHPRPCRRCRPRTGAEPADGGDAAERAPSRRRSRCTWPGCRRRCPSSRTPSPRRCGSPRAGRRTSAARSTG